MGHKYTRVAEAIEKIANRHHVKNIDDLQELFPSIIISPSGQSEASMVDSTDAIYRKLDYTCEQIVVEEKTYWVIVYASTWDDHLEGFKEYARKNEKGLYTAQDIADIQNI